MTDSDSITALEVTKDDAKRLLVDSEDGDGSGNTTNTDTLADHCRWDYRQADTHIGSNNEPDELTGDDCTVARDVEELVPPKRDPCNPVIRSQRRRAVERFESDSDG